MLTIVQLSHFLPHLRNTAQQRRAARANIRLADVLVLRPHNQRCNHHKDQQGNRNQQFALHSNAPAFLFRNSDWPRNTWPDKDSNSVGFILLHRARDYFEYMIVPESDAPRPGLAPLW